MEIHESEPIEIPPGGDFTRARTEPLVLGRHLLTCNQQQERMDPGVMEERMPTRVLICDDEGLTALRYRATLTRMGLEVVGSAANGEQAVESAARLAPDLILMDIEMPELDGVSATRRIMATCPTAIIIISAFSERETVGAAMAAGACGYLVKPVSDDQIAPALQTALERFASRRLADEPA